MNKEKKAPGNVYITCQRAACAEHRSFLYPDADMSLYEGRPLCAECRAALPEAGLDLPALTLAECPDEHLFVGCSFCAEQVYDPGDVHRLPDGRALCFICVDNDICVEGLAPVRHYDEHADQFFYDLAGQRLAADELSALPVYSYRTARAQVPHLGAVRPAS